MYFKALQSFYRAFIPPAGIARARCPPEFAYVFRAFIAAHRAERYRGGDRSAETRDLATTYPSVGMDATFVNFLFNSSVYFLTIIMLRAIKIIYARPYPRTRGDALIAVFIKRSHCGEPQDEYCCRRSLQSRTI
jgi:hypothetical protein